MYLQHFREKNQNYYRGLMPVVENDISHKEIFDMGRPVDTLSTEVKGTPLYDFTPFGNDSTLQIHYEQHFHLMHNVAM